MKRISAALSLALLLLLTGWLLCGVSFETNDDYGIMSFAAGFKTGSPTEATIFTNVLWGYLLSFLYSLTGSVPWYIYAYGFLSWASLAIICYSLLPGDRIRPESDSGDYVSEAGQIWGYILGAAVFAALYFGVLCYYCSVYQFTVVSAMCGIGAICLFLERPRGNVYTYLLFTLLMFPCFTIREKVGYLSFAAFLFAYFMVMISEKKADLIYPLIAGVIETAAIVSNTFYESAEGWVRFREYSAYRSLWTDYPRADFAEYQKLYEGQGWTHALWKMAKKWFFMDRRINKTSFEALTQGYVPEKSDDGYNKFYETFEIMIEDSRFMFLFFVCLIALSALIIVLLYQSRFRESFFLMISLAMAFLLPYYFAYRGRLPYRLSFSLLILFALPEIIYGLKASDWQDLALRPGPGYSMLMTVATVLVVYSFAGGDGLMKLTVAEKYDPEKAGAIETRTAMEEYAIDHRANIYIYDMELALYGNPLTVYPDVKPSNLFFWGGSGMYSPPYYEQLRANGIDSLYSDRFTDGRVFFMARGKLDRDLKAYMREVHPECEARLVERQRGFCVYRFENDENTESD